MTDFVTEIQNDLHALWARLSAEGHSLAASVEAMWHKAVAAGEETASEAEPVVAEAVETVETDAKTVVVDAEKNAEAAAQ